MPDEIGTKMSQVNTKGTNTMPDGENMGHNSGVGVEVEGLTAERFNHHVAAIQRQQANVKIERDKLNKLRKAAKADGIILKEMDAVLVLADEPRADQEAFIERQKLYMEFMRMPVGAQVSFKFDEPKGKAKEKAEADQARGQGFRAGARGEENKPPFDATSPAGQAWIEGWNEGNASFDEALAAQALKDESVDIDEDPMGEEEEEEEEE